MRASFEVATADNFRSLLTLGAFSCLHFSGHGHPHALAFEDACGGAHLVTLPQLRRLMSAGGGQAPVQPHPRQLVLLGYYLLGHDLLMARL